ncbi:MAG: alkaline phosphatase [Ignavibacteriota bacterium]
MKINRITAVFALSLILSSGAIFAQKKNLVMFIGDGYGLAPKVAARMAMGQGKVGSRFSDDPNFRLLEIDKLKYTVPVTTHSLNSWITDSAPGTGVYAIGKNGKQDNEMLAIDATTMKPLQTILEAAKKAGYAVGLVTTTRITHATPAGWASHIWERDLEDYIAAQFISSTEAQYEEILNANGNTYDPNRDWILPDPKIGVEVDVLMGGGSRQFLPKTPVSKNNWVWDKNGDTLRINGKAVSLGSGKRVDNVDLIEIAKTRGYQYVNSRDALLGIDYSQFTPQNNKKLIGLFRDTHMSYEQDRELHFTNEPMLAEMTKVAIEILKRKSDKGFLLLVEGGRIDHLEHANCGGVAFVPADPDPTKNIPESWIVNSDKEAFVDDGSYNGAAGSKTAIQAYGSADPIYGSDYMIKEVLAYDYSIGEGRKLLADASAGQTLLMASSDHECGGFAVVGLHDEADAQKNGTKIRTYAKTPSKSTAFTPTPIGITRGDGDIGGWYPEYSLFDVGGYAFPKAPVTGRRIVVAYGSNPQTNGNSTKVSGGTPGNHTPQDVLAYADDNVGGTFASRITGKGLLDNTDLEPVMQSFLGVTLSAGVKQIDPPVARPKDGGFLFPNPVNENEPVTLKFQTLAEGEFTIDIFNSIGQKIRTLFTGKLSEGEQIMKWNGIDDFSNTVPAGMYIVSVSNGNGGISQKMIVK